LPHAFGLLVERALVRAAGAPATPAARPARRVPARRRARRGR